MNLLKAQDILKGVPDKELANMMQSPRGDIPPFLVASEAARRAKMRQEYQSDSEGKAPTTTVVQDLLNNMGVAALQPPGQQQVPVQAPQMPAAPQQPVQMYDGGIVAFANGGMPSTENIEDYLAPQAGGSEMGFSASVAPYIPGLNARVRAGIIGNAMQQNPEISGYQVGYEDGVNAAMANIIPTPAGNIVGGEYRRQLGGDSEIAVRGNYNPYGKMPAMDFRQAPVSVEYTKRFDKGGIASFQEGGLGDLSAFMPGYAQNIQLEELPGFEDFLSQARTSMGASGLPKYREEIEAERARIAKEEPSDFSSFLKYIGRGLSTAKSPNFVGAVAQGISAGLDMQEQAQQRNREAQRLLRQSEIDLATKERAERAGEYGLARQAQSDAVARRNAGITQLQGAHQLAISGKNLAQDAYDAAEARKLTSRQIGLQETRERNEQQLRVAQIERIKQEIKDGGITPQVRVQAANVVSDAIRTFRQKLDETMPEWYMNSLEKIEKLSGIARQTEMQRLEQQIRIKSGLSSDILKIAGFS